MNHRLHNELSKRERQVMDVIYRRKGATAKQVQEDIPNPPTNAAVRSVLIILEKKGFIKHKRQGKKYIYTPTIPTKKARHSAAKQLLSTYFDNSLESAVSTMLEIRNKDLTEEDLEKLTRMIQNAKKEGIK